eukprot:s319_g12.t1
MEKPKKTIQTLLKTAFFVSTQEPAAGQKRKTSNTSSVAKGTSEADRKPSSKAASDDSSSASPAVASDSSSRSCSAEPPKKKAKKTEKKDAKKDAKKEKNEKKDKNNEKSKKEEKEDGKTKKESKDKKEKDDADKGSKKDQKEHEAKTKKEKDNKAPIHQTSSKVRRRAIQRRPNPANAQGKAMLAAQGATLEGLFARLSLMTAPSLTVHLPDGADIRVAREAKTAAFTAWAQANAQAMLDKASSIGLMTDKFKKEEQLELSRLLPLDLMPHGPEVEKAVAAVVKIDDEWAPNKQAKPVLAMLVDLATEACTFWVRKVSQQRRQAQRPRSERGAGRMCLSRWLDMYRTGP